MKKTTLVLILCALLVACGCSTSPVRSTVEQQQTNINDLNTRIQRLEAENQQLRQEIGQLRVNINQLMQQARRAPYVEGGVQE